MWVKGTRQLLAESGTPDSNVLNAMWLLPTCLWCCNRSEQQGQSEQQSKVLSWPSAVI